MLYHAIPTRVICFTFQNDPTKLCSLSETCFETCKFLFQTRITIYDNCSVF